jgi:putative colanic acid biosynthesis acetyltransferase WcaF
MKVQLAHYNNSWYHIGAPAWKRLLWHFISAIFFENSFFPVVAPKVFLLRCFGAKIGKGVMLKPRLHIKYPWHVSIGEDAWIGEGVWIDSLTTVTIGANVCISQGVYLLTGNHYYNSPVFELMVKPIVLEEGVWIGAQSVVCPGVTCKSHAMLVVGSVASANLDAYGIYRGNPAVWVKQRVIQ